MAMDASRSIVLSAVSGATATNDAFISSADWTLTIPGGVDNSAAALSAVPYRIEVNNANPLDPSKARHYMHPISQALESTSDYSKGSQFSSASAADFESNWVNLGDITASAYVGNGIWRFVRVVNDGGFTGSLSAFTAYLWNWHGSNQI